MSNAICKTLIHVGRVLTTSPSPDLRYIQLLSHNYSNGSGASDSHSFTVSYLINSCRLSPEPASSASKLVNFETPEKPDSVISFLTNHGFSKTQISFIVGRTPGILLSNPDRTLLPKLEFFYSRGVSRDDVAHIVTRAPRILRRSVDDHLVPAFGFLRGFLQSNERTIASIKRFPSVLAEFRHTHLNGSIKMLLDLGVPKENVVFFLHYQPRMFTMGLDRFGEILEDVRKMGFNPEKSSFVQAVHAMRAMSKSTWERKLDTYKRWGLSEEEILVAFKRHPWCMTLSEEKIMLGMDFFVNSLGWKAAAVIKRPVVLSLSLKKRIIPRASVMLFLYQKGLTEKKFTMLKPYMYNEQDFLQSFVSPYLEEVPQLSKIYQLSREGNGIHQL